MSISKKEFKKMLETVVYYYDQEGIRFVLCTAVTNKKDGSFSIQHLTNQYSLDAITTLNHSSLNLLAEGGFSDETISGFQRSLDKSMGEFISIYKQEEALKKESKLVTPISSFEKGDKK